MVFTNTNFNGLKKIFSQRNSALPFLSLLNFRYKHKSGFLLLCFLLLFFCTSLNSSWITSELFDHWKTSSIWQTISHLCENISKFFKTFFFVYQIFLPYQQQQQWMQKKQQTNKTKTHIRDQNVACKEQKALNAKQTVQICMPKYLGFVPSVWDTL